MDIEEIRRQYKYAKDRKKCISILAELNYCSTRNILEIVNVQGKAVCESIDHSTECKLYLEQKALIDRLDELDAMIKPLEDEYRRTAEALMKINTQ